MLLTQKPTEVICLDTTTDKDLYRAQWRRVQALADSFWKRWRSEYLASLQGRRKWTSLQRNVKEGDVVLLKDKDLDRNKWPVALVSKAIQSKDGLTRKVELKFWRDGQPHTFTRPIVEVVVLVEN
jgi:hypothetical protein